PALWRWRRTAARRNAEPPRRPRRLRPPARWSSRPLFPVARHCPRKAAEEQAEAPASFVRHHHGSVPPPALSRDACRARLAPLGVLPQGEGLLDVADDALDGFGDAVG